MNRPRSRAHGDVDVDVTRQKLAEAQLARRVRQQAAVAKLGNSALMGVGRAALVEQAVDLVAHELEVEYSTVMEVAPEFGVLGEHPKVARVFTPDDQSFLWAVANLLGTALERLRIEEELGEKRQELQSLSHKLIQAQEAERRAIARELHDDLGQVLTTIKLTLQRGAAGVAESISLVDEAIATVRQLAGDLRPSVLDDLGLAAALRWYVSRESERAGLEHALDVDSVAGRLPPAVESTCFRIVQEALTNVIRHAAARKVEVRLTLTDSSVVLSVRDDGRGFDVTAARRRAARGESQGLLGMAERAALAGGRTTVDSTLGEGAVVRTVIPLEPGVAR